VQQYAVDNDVPTLSDSDFSTALSYFDPENAEHNLDSLVTISDISNEYRNAVVNYNQAILDSKDIDELITISIAYENNIISNPANLTSSEQEMLLTLTSVTKFGAAYSQTALSNGVPIELFPSIPYMHCGWALFGYAVAFAAMCASGGILLVASVIGFGFSVNTVFESC
jgi:hypothetical protein